MAPMMRSAATVLMWLVTTVLLAASIPAAWAQLNLVDRGGYTALAERAAADPQLQTAMAGELTAQVGRLGSGVDSTVVSRIATAYTSSTAFPRQFAEANDFAHRWLFTNTVPATVDPQGRWVNGTIGKITFLDEEGFGEGSVEVKIQGGNIVEVKPVTWEMFRFFFNEDTQGIESEVVGSFSQLPLKLAWAVTIHKSQGKTFDKVIIDIGNGTFSHGQIYVAMSRCTTFEGIVLRKPIYDHHVLLDPRVVEYMSANQCS